MAKPRQSSFAALAVSLTGARKAPIPDRVEPALAETVATPPDGEQWLHEIKLDGYRMICRKEGQQVRLISRSQQDWSKRFDSLVELATGLKAEAAILDGEVVVTLTDGRASFQALQGELGDPKSGKTLFYAFDLLYLDGFDLTDVKLEQRKSLLQQLINQSNLARIVYCDHIIGHGPEAFKHAARMGVEGIVSKRRDHPYRKGRTAGWTKAKCIQSDDFVVGGYTVPAKADYGIGALLLGQYDRQKRLVYAGRVGTGFSDSARSLLKRELNQLHQQATPFLQLPPDEGGRDVRFVSPALVAHVEYLERAGEWNLVRHAVFRGLRDDLAPTETALSVPEFSHLAPAAKRKRKSRARILSLPEIRFTHPDKLLYPDDGITKLDVAKYYAHVAELMLPHICDRPLTLVRCPEGIGGPQFFQKHPPSGLPEHIKQIEVPSSEGKKIGMAVSDIAGIMSLVQVYALEIHTWGARVDRLDRPDRIVFDLDPDEALPWQRVTDAALKLRDTLAGRGLKSFLLLSGGKGLHIVVPIARIATWEHGKAFSLAVAKQLAVQSPRDFTTNVSLAARRGKIYIDYMRNRRGATSIAPYSTRARPGAPVAFPLAWEELAMLRSAAAYSVEYLRNRVSALDSCPWKGLSKVRQTLKE
jgi:bifunctional non-homologous end joining protein LigD